ncbi:MAG: copper transporter, partial [Microthrixaceae bacterium]|nr:copper transporter [Microthrixaceae bacterium]
MINLRFHIVSIVAVFLALAIGILTGSTLLDRATIQVLEDRQQSLDDRNEELRGRVAALEDNTKRRDLAQAALDDQALAELVPGLVADEPLLLIAARGIDEDTVNGTSELLADAGANVLGTAWFDERLDLREAQVRTRLAAALDVSDSTLAALVEALAVPLSVPTPATTTTTAASVDPAAPVDP